MAAYPTAGWITYVACLRADCLYLGISSALTSVTRLGHILVGEFFCNLIKTLAFSLMTTYRTQSYNSYDKRDSSDLHAQVNVIRQSRNADNAFRISTDSENRSPSDRCWHATLFLACHVSGCISVRYFT